MGCEYIEKPDAAYHAKIRPDIVINKDKPNCFVLDTKWKNLNGYNPSSDDLRQMYVYHEYYGASKVVLVYPGASTCKLGGVYLHPQTATKLKMECSIITLCVEPNIKNWQKTIYEEFANWFNLTNGSVMFGLIQNNELSA